VEMSTDKPSELNPDKSNQVSLTKKPQHHLTPMFGRVLAEASSVEKPIK
jgi:hypothetical protein